MGVNFTVKTVKPVWSFDQASDNGYILKVLVAENDYVGGDAA